MNKNHRRAAILLGAFFLLTATNATAQETKAVPAQTPKPATAPAPQTNPFAAIPAAKPEDVQSADAIVKAVYDVISGDAGQKRDWNRFRSLFYPGARLIPTGTNPTTKKSVGRVITPEEYIERSSALLEKDGFFERELSRRVESFGAITHVFSTYDSKHKKTDAKPFARGINSIQLLNDGTRWWVLTIAWSSETEDSPLPQKYLANGNGN